MPASNLKPADWDEIHARVLAGESVLAVAQSLGRDVGAMYRMLRRRYGFEPRSVSRVMDTTLRLPAENELAYIAGIIDGEGSIGRVGGSWILRVAMCDRDLIEWLGTFGGTVRPKRVRTGHQPQWIWVIGRQLDMQALLRALLPYLRVKRPRAQDCLADLDARTMVVSR